MVSWVVFVLAPLWIHFQARASGAGEPPREAVLSWFKERVLEGLGLEEPPRAAAQGADGAAARSRRAPRRERVGRRTSLRRETSQIILFPSSDSARGETGSHSMYYFQPSVNNRETLVTSAQFWFHAGNGASANSSAQLFVLTSGRQLLQAAEAPSATSSDGWTTYQLDQNLLASVARGPFALRVQRTASVNNPEETPFLHLQAQPRGPVRHPRRALATIPWSPSAVDLLRRPPQTSGPQHGSCRRAEVQISFEELGWGNWIVYPKALAFYYCHGNCSAWESTATMLGMVRCCAPVPGTMKSLRITTTSDSGYSFKYETLPNIMPEECTCF